MGRLELRGVDKAYPGPIVGARVVDLAIEDGELFAIVGPSGSGKSTLLRLIAGLETLDAGTIHLDGRRIDGLPPSARDVALVFQEQVLYPHLDAFENIAFGLRARKVPRPEVESRVRATAAILGLGDCLSRAPGTLSGGQRRRVALARALVLRPKLFLFDEPFNGLDAPLRAATRSELVDLRRELGATMILVTHDQAEALALGDRVAVIDRGRVVQVARPLELYDRPINRFVAGFIGQPPMNILPCRLDRDGGNLAIRIVDLDSLAPLPLSPPIAAIMPLVDRGPLRLDLGLRPEQIRVGPVEAGSNGLATVRRLEPMGHETLAYLDLGPHPIVARLPPRAPWRVGDRLHVEFGIDSANWFHPETGERLA